MTEDQLREAMMASALPRKGQSAWNYHYRPQPRIDHGKVVAMKAEGMTTREIADAVFCEPGAVRQILRTQRLNGGAA